MFKPTLRERYDQLPVYDPTKFVYANTVKNLTFGDLFHEIRQRANNLYDVAKTGPSREGPAMAIFTETITSYLIELAAWLEGQTPTAPDPLQVWARLLDLKRQAFHYDYAAGSSGGVSISHVVESNLYWFVPRLMAIYERALEMKDELSAGKTRVRVTAVFDMELDVAEKSVKEFLTGSACKDLFLAENCRYVKITAFQVKKDDK